MAKARKKFALIEGFGDFEAGLDHCWDVNMLPTRYATEQAAIAGAERRYEREVRSLMKSSPDWKSYWVQVAEV